MSGKDKGGFCNVSVRDNRVGIQFSCSAILSWPKLAVGGAGFALIVYLLLSTWVFGGNPLLRRRVQELGGLFSPFNVLVLSRRTLPLSSFLRWANSLPDRDQAHEAIALVYATQGTPF